MLPSKSWFLVICFVRVSKSSSSYRKNSKRSNEDQSNSSSNRIIFDIFFVVNWHFRIPKFFLTVILKHNLCNQNRVMVRNVVKQLNCQYFRENMYRQDCEPWFIRCLYPVNNFRQLTHQNLVSNERYSLFEGFVPDTSILYMDECDVASPTYTSEGSDTC